MRFSFERGLEQIAQRDPAYDLRMGSDSLAFVFKQAWGIDTLTVNGRFHADPEGLKRLVLTFGVDMLNNTGIPARPRVPGRFRVDRLPVARAGAEARQPARAARGPAEG